MASINKSSVMKFIPHVCFVFFIYLLSSQVTQGQLVTKTDYKAAFALQGGLNTGFSLPGKIKEIKADGTGGLKMTFPFTRKWFLGAEINYNRFRTGNDYNISPEEGGQQTNKVRGSLDMQSLQFPVYIKRTVYSNKASYLFGGYFAYHLKHKLTLHGTDVPSSSLPDKYLESWDAGFSAGFEQQIVKHLNVMLKISASVKNIIKEKAPVSKIYPLQASLTVSYDIFRIGDCGCD